MFTIRKKLSADEGAPANTRVNEEGEVETSYDGGMTWIPNPDADPRTSPAYLRPPTDEGKCAAAAGMIAAMQSFVSDASTVAAPGGLATAILGGVILLIPGLGWMWGVSLIVAGAIAAIGGAAIGTAFTSPVWDELLCILYCGIGEDGSVNQAQLNDIQANIVSDIGGTVSATTALIFQTWGFVGLSNAGALYADPMADCDDCECVSCVQWDFMLNELDDWVIVCGSQDNTFGIIRDVDGCEGSPSIAYIRLPMVIPSGSSINTISIWLTSSGSPASDHLAIYWAGSLLFQQTPPANRQPFATSSFTLTGSGDFLIIYDNNSFGQGASIEGVRFEYTGEAPAVGHACDHIPSA